MLLQNGEGEQETFASWTFYKFTNPISISDITDKHGDVCAVHPPVFPDGATVRHHVM